MTKADLSEALYEQVGYTKKESAELVDMIFDTMKSTLIQGEALKISGFGNFVVREKDPRVGRNPQTGESLVISGRKVVTFKASQKLKDMMEDDPKAN